jgi:heptosyltransferase-3
LSRVFFRKTVESTGVTGFSPFEEWSKLPLKYISKDPGQRIVVHPGSGSESKRWPLQNFMKIIEDFGGHDIPGALVTGEAEENMAATIAKTDLPLNWTWIRRPSILALAGLLSSAHLYLGNDSGPTHLAAACGADVIALFRAEYASAWRPLGRVELLSAPSINEISLEAVQKIIFPRIKK